MKIFTEKTKINNGFSKSCSSNSIFLSENCLQEDLGDKKPWKLNLNSENALFLMACLHLLEQDEKVSFEYMNFHSKRLLILDTQVWFSTTIVTLLFLWVIYRKYIANKQKLEKNKVKISKQGVSKALLESYMQIWVLWWDQHKVFT